MRSIEELPWLRPAPEDFYAQCRAFRAAAEPSDLEFRRLSSFACDITQSERLAATVTSIGDRLGRSGSLADFRLVVLADSTYDFVLPSLAVAAARHGVMLDVVKTDFGHIAEELYSPASVFRTAQADAVLLAYDPRKLGLATSTADPEKAAKAVEAAKAQIGMTIRQAKSLLPRPIIVQTLPIVPDAWCGHLDRSVPGSPHAMIEQVNRFLADEATRDGNVLFDLDTVAALVGRDRWFDAGRWNQAKIPFSLDIVPLYADHLARIVAAMRGKQRKCLVLDLDNTCWGGIIGDDGLEGIRIGNGSADGEAHLALQRYALSLRERGVILAVCSKNEMAAAKLPFQKHPDMALREEHFAAFQANWDDKASNLKHIAKTINIGTDALVFVDDNPVERERVRQMLPEVAVPELPEDPAGYVRSVAAAGYFETLSLSAEDRQRADYYQANAMREQALEQLGDMDAYHRSLEMVCNIERFDAVGRSRIAQLINKSNQYNLTTRRYTEADIAEIEVDPERFAMQIRLKDKFGDNGMISVVIFDKKGNVWTCDTWLMSCRVLGRRVEEAALHEVIVAARAAGASELIGSYIPSAKNAMVKNHFERLGFDLIETQQDGTIRWRLDISTAKMPELPMEIIATL